MSVVSTTFSTLPWLNVHLHCGSQFLWVEEARVPGENFVHVQNFLWIYKYYYMYVLRRLQYMYVNLRTIQIATNDDGSYPYLIQLQICECVTYMYMYTNVGKCIRLSTYECTLIKH